MKRLLDRIRWWWRQPLNQIFCWHRWEPNGEPKKVQLVTQPGQAWIVSKFKCRRCGAYLVHNKKASP